MTKTLEPTVNEIREEAAITKRILERVPGDRLSWRPHPKSMSLGQLAFHIANIPGGIAKLLQRDEFDTSQGNFDPPQPQNVDEIRAAHEQGIRAAEEFLADMTESAAQASWSLMTRGKVMFKQAADRGAALDHAEPLVPPSRAAVGLPAPAGCSCSRDLRPQRG